jgi:hypothetical protein
MEDCLGLSDTPRLEDALKAYVSCSRVRTANDLVIVQPFHPALFMLGEQPGPTLLMSFQRGDLTQNELRAAWKEAERRQTAIDANTARPQATTTRPAGAPSSTRQIGVPRAEDIVMMSDGDPEVTTTRPAGAPSSTRQPGVPRAEDIVMTSDRDYEQPDEPPAQLGADPAQCLEEGDSGPSGQQPEACQPPRRRAGQENSPHALENIPLPCALCKAPLKSRAADHTEWVEAVWCGVM